MTRSAYIKLAKVLDGLPNGFPSTPDGLEIKLLEKIFSPEEADLCSGLRLTFETPEQIAKRLDRPLLGLEDMLVEMWEKGQIQHVALDGRKLFKLLPWVFGIFEYQGRRMDRELAQLTNQYYPTFGKQFFSQKPQLMQVIPVQKTIPVSQEALSYQRVTAIIDQGQSFGLGVCICKKEKRLLGEPCDRPEEVCLAIAPVPGVFENSPWGKAITREAARAVLEQAEEHALVHLTYNLQDGHFFICNCCSCCCGVLRSINELGIRGSINSLHTASIDEESCSICGFCAEERCQVGAINQGDAFYEVDRERCIGCGLCVTTCPAEAISLVPRDAGSVTSPPRDLEEWFRDRARSTGKDLDKYL